LLRRRCQARARLCTVCVLWHNVMYWMCSYTFSGLSIRPLCAGTEWRDQRRESGGDSLETVTAEQLACDARMLACRHRSGDRAGARQHAAVRAQRDRGQPHPKICVFRAKPGNARQVARECPPGWCAAALADQLGSFCAAELQMFMYQRPCDNGEKYAKQCNAVFRSCPCCPVMLHT